MSSIAPNGFASTPTDAVPFFPKERTTRQSGVKRRKVTTSSE